MKSKEKGFTLIEVSAALAIIGIGILLVLRFFSEGLRSIKATDDYTREVILAEKKLAEIFHDERVGEGQKSGTEDGYMWVTEVSAYEDIKYENADFRILRISVSVSNPEGKKEFKLESLKLAQEKVAQETGI